MTEFERKQLDILKTINRNINYVGRKLEMIDSTLQKHGIAIMPGAEATEEEPEKDYGEQIADEIIEKCF